MGGYKLFVRKYIRQYVFSPTYIPLIDMKESQVKSFRMIEPLLGKTTCFYGKFCGYDVLAYNNVGYTTPFTRLSILFI
ncbi:hypothetical protein EZS27_024756 [termite gut metagenome]|uniref:Uncharacterized protein n=1 Tax=termite gut metagenome TaxID=433724 RepID=A0A5J4QYA9_9ZZZZ